MIRSRRELVLIVGVLFVAAAALLATSAQGKSKAKGWRTEIAQLKARIAQLESAVEFQFRRGAPPSGVILPGGLCADPCATDSDGDGLGDCEDPCPCDPSGDDSDADGTPDCQDPCPEDPNNTCFGPCHGDPGTGCSGPCPGDPNVVCCPEDPNGICLHPCRIDSDGDGLTDCEDPCPWDPAPAHDEDGDGIPDCGDPCPHDRDNDCVPVCALDADGDGRMDCEDPCPWGESGERPCISTLASHSAGR